MINYRNKHHSAGFSLVEMAIVLTIVALLMAGLIPSISGQIDQKRTAETRIKLDEIQQALIGFAVANGRLPCPATAASNGAESYVGAVGASACTSFNNGFIPAVTLGIASESDSLGNQGYAVDAWGNRIRYAVTNANGNAFITTSGMKSTGITTLDPNLMVCTKVSATANDCSVAADRLTTGVPAVIYSTGKNGAYGGTGSDEAENPNPNSADNDRAFVSHVPAPSSAANGEFDDIVIWVSDNLIINRMVAAGQLP